MSHPLADDPEPATPTLERWLERGQSALGLFGTRVAGELREVGKRVGGSTVLRHGLAALERGNVEAAFWLLREEVAAHPEETVAVQTFWNVAVSCDRAEAAAGAMARLVAREALEDAERASEAWMSLDAEAPDAPVDALTLARLLPALKARVAAAMGEERRQEAQRWLARALERCVEAGSGLEGGVALRVFEEARERLPEVARRAAEIALRSPNLHEAKRERLEAFVGGSSGSGIAVVRA